MIASKVMVVPAAPSAASGTLPRCPTTAVSIRMNSGSAASTTNADAARPTMRRVETSVLAVMVLQTSVHDQ